MDIGKICSQGIDAVTQGWRIIQEILPSAMTCPYCLNHMTSFDLEKVCSICGREQGNNRGNIAQRLLRTPIPCADPTCNGRYTNIKCRKCNHILPPSFDQFNKYMRLAIVAPSGAGKTVFITTMLEEMYANSRMLGLNVSPLDEETADYHAQNVSQLYNDKRTLPGTPAGVIMPLQLKIQNTKMEQGNIVPTYSLTIFDGAGEDQVNVNDRIGRYITEAKMILLLLDPTKLYGVRSVMTEDEIIKSGGSPNDSITHSTTQDFINKIINYIKATGGININRKLETPVAVTFAKMDILRRFFPENSIVFKRSGHIAKGRLDDEEAKAVHAEIDNWMTHCGDDLSNTFDSNFSTWMYFGASSLGVQPDDGNTLLDAPKPLRVLDPLLWNFKLEEIDKI